MDSLPYIPYHAQKPHHLWVCLSELGGVLARENFRTLLAKGNFNCRDFFSMPVCGECGPGYKSQLTETAATVPQELILALSSAGRALLSMINEFHLVSSKSDCAVPCCYLFMFSTKKFM